MNNIPDKVWMCDCNHRHEVEASKHHQDCKYRMWCEWQTEKDAQHSVQPTLLQAREIEVTCPDCDSLFVVVVPAPQSR